MAGTKSTATLLVAALALLMVPATDAQSPTVAPGPFQALSPSPAEAFDCVNALINISDCLTFVEAGSNLSKPDKACCPEIAGMVETQPICLCQLLADPENVVGIKIELKKALKLPSICKLNTPSATLCSAIGIPFGAPTAGQESASPPGGFPSSPAAGNRHSAATTVAFLKKSFLLGFAIMVFANLF